MAAAFIVYTLVNSLISIGAYKLDNTKGYARFAAIILALFATWNMQGYIFLLTGIINLLILEIYFYKKRKSN